MKYIRLTSLSVVVLSLLSLAGCSNVDEPSAQEASRHEIRFTSNLTGLNADATRAYGSFTTYNMGQNAKFNIAVEEDIEPTMVAKGPGAVGQPIYHSSKNSFHTDFSDRAATDTLVATDFKDPPTVSKEPDYIVRRLTPTECARLQGFPDWWCANLGTENPIEEDITFWHDVFETHRAVVGGSSKPKSDRQIIKWIQNPHSDSAEYKMWGNGINLNIAVFVLSGIKYFDKKGDPDEL